MQKQNSRRHLYFDNWAEDDQTWREFVGVEATGEVHTDVRGIEDFLKAINKSS